MRDTGKMMNIFTTKKEQLEGKVKGPCRIKERKKVKCK